MLRIPVLPVFQKDEEQTEISTFEIPINTHILNPMERGVNERKKSCPRCGTEFGCCTENCWCSELPNIMPLVDNEDCLCYDCLKKEIDRKVELIN